MSPTISSIPYEHQCQHRLSATLDTSNDYVLQFPHNDLNQFFLYDLPYQFPFNKINPINYAQKLITHIQDFIYRFI